jgi:iron-sulfur cluster repair protein YtfE (RIC family)
MDDELGGSISPEDAVKVLLEGHERIREFLALARRVGGAAVAAPDSIPEAALRAQRYFSRALPLHVRDEEESVLPRLRGKDPVLDEALEAMAREHHTHSRALASLAAACEEIARVPARLPELAPYLTRVAAELERHFAEHLAREEVLIFPAMRRFLDASASEAIVREIRERRVGAGPDVESDAAPPQPGSR